MDKQQLEALLDEADELRKTSEWSNSDEAEYNRLIDLFISMGEVDSDMERAEGASDSSGEISAKANALANTAKQEFNQFVDTVEATSVQDVEEAAKGVAGDIGGHLGAGTRWLYDKASSILDHPDWKKLAAVVGEGNKLKAETHMKQGEIAANLIQKYGPQAAQTASDLAILYIIWATPIIPPQYKVIATLDTAITITGLTGPTLLKFIEEFAEGLGHPLSAETISGLETQFNTMRAISPRLVLKQFLTDTVHPSSENNIGSQILRNAQDAQQQIQSTAWGLVPQNKNKGGLLSDKISKIHGEGYTAPGQAYAIAKSMGYNRGGLLCKK